MDLLYYKNGFSPWMEEMDEEEKRKEKKREEKKRKREDVWWMDGWWMDGWVRNIKMKGQFAKVCKLRTRIESSVSRVYKIT